MKNITLSVAAVFAMSSFSVAGGDIVPIVEPVVEEVVVEYFNTGFYLGLGYGILSGDQTFIDKNCCEFELESRDFDQLLLQAGYKINDYVAIEGRYWFGMNDLDGDFGIYEGHLYSSEESLDAWGIYVKPMYPMTETFDVYALLGYGTATLEQDYKAGDVTFSDSTDLDGFSWGIGAAFSFNDSISIFADYVVLYDDTYEYNHNTKSEFTVDTVNFGVSYNF